MIKHIAKQCIRGTKDLPYVGEHPGTPHVFFILMLGFLAGLPHGIMHAIAGFVVVTLFFLPIYLYGAYERTKLSDKLSEKENERF